MKLLKVFFLFLFIFTRANSQLGDPIIDLLSKYNRSVTVLEIAKSFNETDLYSLMWAANKKDNITSVVILLEDVKNFRRIIAKNNYNKIMLLEPEDNHPETFRTLSRCEHFDFVIIHDDLYPKIRSIWTNYLNSFYNLGDFVIFEISNKNGKYLQDKIIKTLKPEVRELGVYNNSKFFIHESGRKGLDIARWNKRHQSEHPDPRYKIISNFKKKLFVKPNGKKLKWVDGINLSTFVMMRGLYPDDRIISRGLTKMAAHMPYHNDLIIGNIIIQGHKLVPIDFSDKRRNANMNKLLKRAFNVFNGDGRRLKDPQERMRIYSQEKI